jgi:hypothetical protein
MKAFPLLACAAAALSAAVVALPNDGATYVTVTVPCGNAKPTGSPTSKSPAPAFGVKQDADPYGTSTGIAIAASPTPASYMNSNPGVPYSGAPVLLGPVSNPHTDPSDPTHFTPKANCTLHYGSNDTSTPDTNAIVSLEMKKPAVLLENIRSVKGVVCSSTGVVITFSDDAGYKMSMNNWPTSGDFIMFTNHFGNCDAEFERGLFLVGGLTFDETTLTVVATAEKSDFQTLAGMCLVNNLEEAQDISRYCLLIKIQGR